MSVAMGDELMLTDFKFAVRQLLKNPGFTAIAVLTLALGLGANTAIFSLFNTMFLSLVRGVERPRELVAFNLLPSQNGGAPLPRFSYPDYVDFRDRNDVFAGLAASSHTFLDLEMGERAEKLQGRIVSGNYFDVLGVRAVAGRGFRLEETQVPGRDAVAVISEPLWRRRFDSDPRVIGQSIKLNRQSFTVIGVMPAFHVDVPLLTAEVWVPIQMHAQLQPDALNRARRGAEAPEPLSDRSVSWLEWIGRLKPNVPLGQAQAAVQVRARQLAEAYEALTIFNYYRATVIPAREAPLKELERARPVGIIFLGLASLVLIIACANLANLLLARAMQRREEIAVRLALGAGRWRLIRQLLTESLLLALMGGVIGLVFTVWTSTLLSHFLASVSAQTSFPFRLELPLDLGVFGYTLAVSLLTGLIFGLAPASRAARADLVSALKKQEPAVPAFSRRFSARNLLVTAQVAVCLLLLIVAGLFARGLQASHHIDLGFNPDQVLVVPFNLEKRRLPEPAARQLLERAVERARSIPGTQSVGLLQHCPGDETLSNYFVTASGVNTNLYSMGTVVGADYFQAMGVWVLRGRGFEARDRGGPPVVIINESLARQLWPTEEAIGKLVKLSQSGSAGPREIWAEVVGVAKNGKYFSLWEPDRAFLYRPLAQQYGEPMTMVVRTRRDTAATITALRAELKATDSELPVFHLQPLKDKLAGWFLLPQMGAILIGAVGLLGLMLACVGLAGLIAFTVSQRTHEIGVRMALGARRDDVLRLVMRQGIVLTSLGIIIGLVLAGAATRIVAHLIFGVSARDPATFAGVTLLMALVSLFACYWPARRATKVDPIVALRYE